MTHTWTDLTVQQNAALSLADRGLSVFPVDHPAEPECAGWHRRDASCDGTRGKHPACSWSKASTVDPAEIGRMFGRGLRNIGVDAGRSGLLVLDEDTPGEVARLCAELEVPRPATFTVSTGRGAHFYFRQSDDRPFGNGVGRLAAYQVDVRGRGGYVVGPGSMHASGRRYEIADAAPIVPVPQWLADALRPPAPRRPTRPAGTRVSRREIGAVLDVVLNARPGNRNAALYWAARRLLDKAAAGQLDADTAMHMVLDAADQIGLPTGEARATVDSARKAVTTPR